MRRLLEYVPAPLLVGLAAFACFLFGWRLGGRPVPAALVARVDTVLLEGRAVHDTVVQLVRVARLERDTVVQLLAGADTIRILAQDTSRSCSERLAWWGRLDSLQVDAGARCLAALGKLDSAATKADRHGQRSDSTLKEARGYLRRPPRWSLGPVWEAGRLTPVGGELLREVGPLRLGLQLTDGAGESATVRATLQLRF